MLGRRRGQLRKGREQPGSHPLARVERSGRTVAGMTVVAIGRRAAKWMWHECPRAGWDWP